MQQGGELLRVGHVRVKPHRLCGRFQNDRHAVMDCLQVDCRLRRNDGKRIHLVAIRVDPGVIEPGKGEVLACVSMDVVTNGVSLLQTKQ